MVIARRIADRMDSAVIRIAEVELEDNGARPQMRPRNEALVHELRATCPTNRELHGAARVAKVSAERLANRFQRNASQDAPDR